MNYCLTFNDKEYYLSEIIFINMEEEITSYIKKEENIKYININKILLEGNYNLLKKIYNRISSYIGMTVLDTEWMVNFSRLGYRQRQIDSLSNYYYQNDNIKKANELLLEGIILSLETLNDIISKEKNINSNKK